MILAMERAAEARRIVARQEQLIAELKATGRPSTPSCTLKRILKRLNLLRLSNLGCGKNAEPKSAKPKSTNRNKSEDERYAVADYVVDQLKQHGDPWKLSEEARSKSGPTT